MKIKIMVAALLITLISAAACTAASAGTANNNKEDMKEIAITASDEFDRNQHIQKEVEIGRGNTLVVTLLSNGTTGFSWGENARIADTGIIHQLEHQYVDAETDIVGAPGVEKWTFEALDTGTTIVHLEYGQPWEGGEKGVWIFDLTVIVK